MWGRKSYGLSIQELGQNLILITEFIQGIIVAIREKISWNSVELYAWLNSIQFI